MPDPDTPLGRGCWIALGIGAGFAVVAFLAGWIYLLDIVTFAENSGVNP